VSSHHKIAIIGGGSAYVPGILHSLIRAEEALRGTEIALMDIAAPNMAVIARLGKRMIEEAGVDLKLSSTTDLKEALDGADFVLSNFRAGGFEATRQDYVIPDKYDLIGQETTGPGGTFFALRSIPQMLDLCAAMGKHCPDAWLINYVNPTNFVADAIRRESAIKCIAVCDGGGNHLAIEFSEILGVPKEAVRVVAPGVNHHTWVKEVTVDGRDAYPLIREHFAENRKADFATWAMDRLGVFPAISGYLYQYFDYPQALADSRRADSIFKWFMNELSEQWARFEAMADGTIPVSFDETRHHTDTTHGDIAVNLMVCICTNRAKEFHVNTPNIGAITNLPADAIVEVPTLVDASGVKPLCLGEMPRSVLGLTQALLNWQELTVDAALCGERDLVVRALMAHPWLQSRKVAEELCDEMLAVHAAFLPQFRAG
jgi:6-phospho-beta-glucosidase